MRLPRMPETSSAAPMRVGVSVKAPRLAKNANAPKATLARITKKRLLSFSIPNAAPVLWTWTRLKKPGMTGIMSSVPMNRSTSHLVAWSSR